MENTSFRRFIFSLIGALLVIVNFQSVNAESDPRFFGTYCGQHREPLVIELPCGPFGWFRCERTEHINLSITAQAEHWETRSDVGLVHGSGRAEITGHTFPDRIAERYGLRVGDTFPFVFAGRVTACGHLEGSGRSPGRESTQATATLSADGKEIALRAFGLNNEIKLRKDRCGNTAPNVAMTLPSESTFRWGQSFQLSGTVTDDHDNDASIPNRRKVWTSSIDSLIGEGRTIFTNKLSQGRHRITYTVTDNGGLSGSASKYVTIQNTYPRVFIDRPNATSGPYYENTPISFRGHAHDSEQGNLTGRALTWTSAAGLLGTGNGFIAPLPAGSHTIRLSATDGELIGRAEVSITVHRCPGGNCPPGVQITSPPHLSAPVGDTPPFNCLTFTAAALDPEDGMLSGNALVWSVDPDGASPPREITERGESVTICFEPTGGDLWYEIKITATDLRGNTASDWIRILVIGGGLI